MIIRAFSAILGTALLAAPAWAQAGETVSARVAIADLDLSADRDRARLDRRVRQAAGQLCGAEPRGVAMRSLHQRCRADVLEDAAVKIAQLKAGATPVQVARRSQ